MASHNTAQVSTSQQTCTWMSALRWGAMSDTAESSNSCLSRVDTCCAVSKCGQRSTSVGWAGLQQLAARVSDCLRRRKRYSSPATRTSLLYMRRVCLRKNSSAPLHCSWSLHPGQPQLPALCRERCCLWGRSLQTASPSRLTQGAQWPLPITA